MKRKLAAMLTAIMVLGTLTGCSGGESEQRAALAGAAARSALLRVPRFVAARAARAANALAGALLAEPERAGALLRHAAGEPAV